MSQRLIIIDDTSTKFKEPWWNLKMTKVRKKQSQDETLNTEF